MEEPTSEDWKRADKHLATTQSHYKALVGMSGVLPGFAINNMNLLRTRYERGERSRKLYDEMMRVE